MKSIFLSALIGVGIVTLISPVFSGSSAARTPQSYPLVCRGGGSLVIGIAPGERNIGFTFTRGTKPAREGLARVSAPGRTVGCILTNQTESPSMSEKVMKV